MLLRELSSNLEQNALTIAATVTGDPAIWEDPERAQQLIARISLLAEGRRVLLLNPEGTVIASSGDAGSAPLEGQLPSEIPPVGETSVKVSYGLFRQTAEALVPVAGVNQQLLGIVSVTHSLEGVADQFASLRRWMLGILLGEILLAVVLGTFLATRLARPISRAACSVVDIAYGVTVEPAEPAGPEEIQQLTQAVNLLSLRLSDLEEMRQRSLANIVHELGRPLGAMRSAVHVLRGPPGDDLAIREELLEGIEAQIVRLEPLLDDLAQLHGQVSGEVHLNPLPVQVNDWLPPVLLPWRAAALEKGLDWDVEIMPGLPAVTLDPDKMAQVVGNLWAMPSSTRRLPDR